MAKPLIPNTKADIPFLIFHLSSPIVPGDHRLESGLVRRAQ